MEIALFLQAREGLANAHAPYSGHKVGAAVLTQCGCIYNGGNVESSSSKCSICAETFVMSKAVLSKRIPIILCVVSMHDEIVTPCGFCRQFLVDFPDLNVILFNSNGMKRNAFTVTELMPNPYIRKR